jgi:hypothetical protein
LIKLHQVGINRVEIIREFRMRGAEIVTKALGLSRIGSVASETRL